MSKGIVIFIVVVIVAVAVSFFITQQSGNNFSSVSTGETVTIGFIGPLTGDAVSYGEPVSNAVRLAVDDINGSGGINGATLEVIYEDGKCTGKDAVNAAQKLINVDGVKVIIGGVCSGEALAILPIARENGVLVLSPSASSPDLTGADPLFFRNNPSDDSGGAFLADFIRESHESVAVVSENTDYAQALRGVFTEQFTTTGGEVVADESFAPETGDFRSILTKVKAANPEAVFINPQTEIAGGTIARQARELGIDVPLFGSNVVSGSKAVEIGGDSLEGLYLFDSPGLNPNNPKAVAFLEEYEAQYGDLSIEFYLGAGYDAVHILADAIGRVGLDTAALQADLEQLPSFDGVIGTYSFDAQHDLSGIKHVLKRIEGGEVVTVE